MKKNIVINVPLSIFGNHIVLLFTNSREQYKITENNRFLNFFQDTRKVSPFYIYWPNLVLLAWIQPILWMIQYFSKYIGNIWDLPISRYPPSLKHQYFSNGCLYDLEISQKIVKKVTLKSFRDLPTSVFELFKIK